MNRYLDYPHQNHNHYDDKSPKVIGISVAGLVAFIGILSAFLSPKSHLERSIVINAPAATIFEQINNLENTRNWAHWQA